MKRGRTNIRPFLIYDRSRIFGDINGGYFFETIRRGELRSPADNNKFRGQIAIDPILSVPHCLNIQMGF